jgi:hypothetical protein
MVESRAYGPDSTADEIEALKARVYEYSHDTVMWHEVPVTSEFQAKVCSDKLCELAQKFTSYFLLVDLSNTGLPEFKVMRQLSQTFSKQENLVHIAIFNEKNIFLNIAARNVLNYIGFESFSLHKTKEQALQAIEDIKKKVSY